MISQFIYQNKEVFKWKKTQNLWREKIINDSKSEKMKKIELTKLDTMKRMGQKQIGCK